MFHCHSRNALNESVCHLGHFEWNILADTTFNIEPMFGFGLSQLEMTDYWVTRNYLATGKSSMTIGQSFLRAAGKMKKKITYLSVASLQLIQQQQQLHNKLDCKWLPMAMAMSMPVSPSWRFLATTLFCCWTVKQAKSETPEKQKKESTSPAEPDYQSRRLSATVSSSAPPVPPAWFLSAHNPRFPSFNVFSMFAPMFARLVQ